MTSATLAARFHPLGRAALAGVAYTSLLGAAFAGWHRAVGTEPAWLALAISVAPALLATVAALTSPQDRRQYIARVLVVVLMAPILQLFWSLEEPTHWGPGMALAIGGALLHAVAFVLAVRWLAAETTAIDAAPHTPAASRAALALRLASLGTLELGLRVDDRAAPAGLRFVWQPSGDSERCHHVELRLDEAAHAVVVLERLQADGAAPVDADEASLRGAGDSAFDPTRPDAQRVWLRTLQTTMLDAAQVEAAPVVLQDGRAAWSGAGRPALPDTDTLMALLAKIVLHSGWAWRPRMG